MSLNPYHNTSHSDGPNIFNSQRRRSIPILNDDKDSDSLSEYGDTTYRPRIFGADRPHTMSGSGRPTRCPPGADCWPRIYDLPGTFPRGHTGFQVHRDDMDGFSSRGRGVDMNDLVIGGPRRRYGHGYTVEDLEDDLSDVILGIERIGRLGFGPMSADGYMGFAEEDVGENVGIGGRQRYQHQREYQQASSVGLGGPFPRMLHGGFNGGLGEGLGGAEDRYGERDGGLFDGLGDGLGGGFGRRGWGGRR